MVIRYKSTACTTCYITIFQCISQNIKCSFCYLNVFIYCFWTFILKFQRNLVNSNIRWKTVETDEMMMKWNCFVNKQNKSCDVIMLFQGPNISSQMSKLAIKVLSKVWAGFVWNILTPVISPVVKEKMTQSGNYLFSSICFLFFFGLRVTRIQPPAASCQLFHLATGQKLLWCSVSSSRYQFGFDLVFLITFSPRLSVSPRQTLYFIFFSWLLRCNQNTASPAWLGLSPWSHSHRAHRPCRPYGTTQSDRLYYMAYILDDDLEQELISTDFPFNLNFS